jgi:hypothetical protein
MSGAVLQSSAAVLVQCMHAYAIMNGFCCMCMHATLGWLAAWALMQQPTDAH